MVRMGVEWWVSMGLLVWLEIFSRSFWLSVMAFGLLGIVALERSCESDSLEVVRLIHSSLVDSHHFQAVIMEIQHWLNMDWIVSVKHYKRGKLLCGSSS